MISYISKFIRCHFNEGIAHQQAVIALDRYKKNAFGGKVGRFIEDMVKQAKMKSKKVK